jgi:Tfp pilus assembly PilM family ATPase
MLKMARRKGTSIGIDTAGEGLHLVQLSGQEAGSEVLGLAFQPRPEHIESGTAAWQRWGVESLQNLAKQTGGYSKSARGVISASQMIVETVERTKLKDEKFLETMVARMKPRIENDCTKETLVIKDLPIDQTYTLVMATDREWVNRYLATYEKAGLEIEALYTWPEALNRCYCRFFGRRESDRKDTVMLLDVRRDYTHGVICRHDKIFFARRLSVGGDVLGNKKMLDRLILEIGTCRRDFAMLYSDVILSRLVFLSGASVPNEVYMAIAKELEMTAMVGDCLNAVAQTSLVTRQKELNHTSGSWASAFGICLM